MEGIKNNYHVCPKYNSYFRVHTCYRIKVLTDGGTFEEWNGEMSFSNPLNFPGYERKVIATGEKDHLNKVVVTGKCKVDGDPTVIGVCDTRFIMSGIGHVVGGKIADAMERATRKRLPIILLACSGGARIQEGTVSLMQTAKTPTALECRHEAGRLFVNVLIGPTMEDVTTNFVMLGGIILAEPHVLTGFAGPRVIEQTIGQKLSEEFQRSEFPLEYGFMDKTVGWGDQKGVIDQILYMHRGYKVNIELKSLVETARTFVDEPSQLQTDSGKTT